MKRPTPQASAWRNRQTLTSMSPDTDGHPDPAAPLPDASARPHGERDRQLREHAPLVKQVAGRLRRRLPGGVDIDELMQAGLIGLNEALSRYDTTFGASFGTYAARRIEGAMLDSLRAGDELSREVRGRQ